MLLQYLAPAAALLGLAAAQVKSDCNPLESTKCPANPALGTTHHWDFTTTPSRDLWETHVGTIDFNKDNGATFTINRQGDSPTLRSKFYFFFGRTEIWMKASPGIGIVSSMMWLSDVLDEVDWEFLGANNTHATSNYFGKGHEDFSKGKYHPMEKGMQDDYHNYTITWTAERLDWYIDGNCVRTLLAAEANNGENYPQTPMRLSLGIWAGGDPTLPEGTRQWAGGDTVYSNGPYNMYVREVTVEDYSSGKEYKYGDQSGSWKSIKITEGNSSAIEAIDRKPEEIATEKTATEKWNELTPTAKTAVYAGSAGAASLGLGALVVYYFRQRRRGAEEAKAERDQLMSYRNGEDVTQQGHEYNSGGWTRLR